MNMVGPVPPGEFEAGVRRCIVTSMLVYKDGDFMAEEAARIPLTTHGFQYGTGVFEGIRAYHDPDRGEMFLFRAREHFDRMASNVRFLKIKLQKTPGQLVEVAADLVRKNRLKTNVYIRPVAFKSSTTIGVSLPEEDGFAMIAMPMGEYLDTSKGLHCGVSSWRRISDNAIPCRAKICGSYVNSALAAQEARDRGFDEALFLNEAGSVAEGSAMNIFIVRDGRLITPDVTQGILEGVTRDTVMTLCKESMGLKTETRAVDRAELYVADEIFLCGTAAQIAPVTMIDGREIREGKPGSITLELKSLYEKVVRGKVPEYRRWLRAVYSGVNSAGPYQLSRSA
jgi:branched-chain amino acid aminotransferase